MRVAWLTDIHLDFVDESAVDRLGRGVARGRPDVCVISGDISIAHRLEQDLMRLQRACHIPIYFVLGNHDFYFGSIAAIRRRMTELFGHPGVVHWLPAIGVVPLSETTALVGHDGWADGRFGDFARSPVRLSDHVFIEELAGLEPDERLARLNSLGDESAQWFASVLDAALDSFRHLLVLTHVPPFAEACWHQGEIADDDHLPHFACRAVGEVLRAAMSCRTDRTMTVLCGHTHSSGEARILPNLDVITGAAEYGAPRVQRFLEMP
jgi:3',5'-cyclic AMP phosphodiesterase CpdA